MPHLEVVTSVPRSAVPADFLQTSSALIAKLLGKPESYCVVSVHPDTLMSWGGKTEPCAIVRLMSLGALGPTQNQDHSKALFAHLEKTLGLPSNRVYISFADELPSNLGHQGTTFEVLLG